MDHIGVIGLTWRQGGPEALVRFGLNTGNTSDSGDSGESGGAISLAELRDALGVSELVFLSTCNRVEIYFSVEEMSAMAGMRGRAFLALTGSAGEPGEAERTLRAWAGEGAAEHLFLVAAGLDSAEIGETEIGGQLRRAMEASREAGVLGVGSAPLDTLMEEALRLSKRIRSNSGLTTGKTSLAEIALDKIRGRLGKSGGAVALVGVSPMTERCALALGGEGVPLILVNRTLDHAIALRDRIASNPKAAAIQVRGLEEFRKEPPPHEALLTATGAPGVLLEGEALVALANAPLSGEALLIIDMAVPADVEAAWARALGMDYIGMDGVIEIAEASRGKRLREMAGAREEIDEALGRLRIRMGDERVAPLVSALQKRYRKVAKEGAQRLLSTSLADVGEEQAAAVLRFAESLAGRLAHLPSTGLRGVARVAGSPAVNAFLSQADGEMAKEFELARREARGAGPVPDTEQRPDRETEPGPAQSSEGPNTVPSEGSSDESGARPKRESKSNTSS